MGWNTTFVDRCWGPTFPNAEVVASDPEYAYGLTLTDEDAAGINAARDRAGLGEPVRVPVSGTFADCILPLVGKSPVRRVRVDGAEVFPGIRFLPTPGHSIDHATIELVNGGEKALFSGDVLNHPVQVYYPDLVSTFCEFPDTFRRSLGWFLDHAASTNSMVFSSDSPKSLMGQISRIADGYAWSFGAPIRSLPALAGPLDMPADEGYYRLVVDGGCGLSPYVSGVPLPIEKPRKP
ncbi:hypothetical protein PCPL58_3689 [Pseudomonas cerasi]|uniref:Metallo-beta-lactamase domain-containing protein n=1 Tax=Pseudomonas cerasi TaxID=1583341 RepID=A0A193SSY8_9PSED|nr:hypothetical protein PCPL58_3689 [Pseudomonas cerasi]SOS21866.1 hypothetical protein PL963_03779 [Pseudomonas cerasi]